MAETIFSETTTLLNAAAATGAGAASTFKALNITYQAVVTGTATVEVQGSNDGTNWVQIANFTASGASTKADAFKYVRANVTAYTSGAVTVIAGY